jgi:hypothetical protein
MYFKAIHGLLQTYNNVFTQPTTPKIDFEFRKTEISLIGV